MYWRSPDCSERYLSELPRGRIADFIRDARRRVAAEKSTSSVEKLSTKVVPTTTSKSDFDVLTVDPFRQETYLTSTQSSQIFQVSVRQSITSCFLLPITITHVFSVFHRVT